jgi:hypothetical protein
MRSRRGVVVPYMGAEMVDELSAVVATVDPGV